MIGTPEGAVSFWIWLACWMLGAGTSGAPENAAPQTPCGPVVEGMACIPAGEFLRGSNDGPRDERPAEKITLDAFYMDVYEVPFPEYQACAKAGKCRPARPNYKNFSDDRQPMVGLPWFGAEEFCRFKGKRLPTEAEWEKAARGVDGRKYPWGDAPATCDLAIIDDRPKATANSGNPKGGQDLPLNGCSKGTTWAVGSRAPNQYGLYDMSGNAWEWVADWYSKSYQACGQDCQGQNPKGPCQGAEKCPGHLEKVVRGGSWFWDASWATTTKRRSHFPENKPQYHHFGFRCAKDATP